MAMMVIRGIFSLHLAKRTAGFTLSRGALSALALLAVSGALEFAVTPNARANDPRDPWFFTAKEVQAAYQYQENYGGRIRYPLRLEACFLGREEFVLSHGGAEFTVPCHFIAETTRHLQEMLNAGAARYLFPLDADHAHLGVPTALWESKYRHLRAEQILGALLREPKLVALYHTAEHLEIRDSKQGAIDPQTQAWMEKRNVLGFFDERPIQILPPDPKGYGVAMPEEYETYGGFNFLASPAGALFVFVGNRVITFDISFDTDRNESRGAAIQSGAEKKLLRTSR